MITSRLVKRPAVIAAICLMALSFITLGFIIKPQQSSWQSKNYQVYKTLSANEIKQVLAKSKSNQLWLDLYTVKQTADINKKDFDVVIVPRDKEGKPVTQTNKTALEKGSANYAAFLHKKNIPAEAVALGYHVTIDESKLQGQSKLNIIVDVLKSQFSKVYISGPQYNISFSDSAPIGKCPPACAYDAIIMAVMEKEYTQNYPVHKILSAKEIKQILTKTNSNRLWLDLYFVKQTPGMKKKDFNLLIIPRDNEGNAVTKISKDTLEKGLTNYAQVMHKKKLFSQ